MAPDYSAVIGSEGVIAKSGKSIYDAVHDSPDFFLAGGDLEAILRAGLVGLNLNYPLRTRSKVLKSRICEILGYPVPASFKKSKPRLLMVHGVRLSDPVCSRPVSIWKHIPFV